MEVRVAETFKPCSIAGCKGNAHHSAKGARGWCRRHYRLWQAHGEPVARKAANGEPMQFLRDVVLRYEGEDCLIWPFATSNGYGWVNNPEGTCLAHRIACEHRNGPPPSSAYEAAHSCGKGASGCVTPAHLRWALPVENQAERVDHGTSNRGEQCANAKLTEAEAREIRGLRGVLLQRELADQYGVSVPTICSVQTGASWRWLDA